MEPYIRTGSNFKPLHRLKRKDKDSNQFDNLKVEKLRSDVINTLARDLPKDWIELARFLGVNDKEIIRAKKKYETNKEQAFQILSSWCRNNPNREWKDIKSRLVFLKRRDVIINCERKLSVQSTFGIQPSSDKFFSREEILRQTHYNLFELKDTKKSNLVLYGMSGVGKTQIARKYCEVYHSFYENIIWIDAASEKIDTSIKNLYQTLGFIADDDEENYSDIKLVIEKIHNYYKNENTLYIFDNVDNENIKNIQMYISSKSSSFTLITSQWRMWSDNVHKMLIDVFSPEDAFTYVKNNIRINNEEKTRELVKELGFHPFAITQAIKYLNIHNLPIEKYLNRYRSHPIEILDIEKLRTEEESKSAIIAINLVLIKIEKTRVLPLKILNLLSHCDGQNISKHFIIQISKYLEIIEENVIEDAIRLLQSYSLLDCFGDDKYTMHELTQLSCKYFQIKNSSTNLYINLVKNYLKFELEEVNEHIDYGNHFVLHFFNMFRSNEESMCKAFDCWEIYNFLTNKGLFLEALKILKAIESFNAKNYGENDELTLDTKYVIAVIMYQMGKYNEALEIFDTVIKIQTKVLGCNHPSTMDTKIQIAYCLQQIGRYDEALEINNAVDKIQTELLGINHPLNISAKTNKANCLLLMEKFNEALEISYSVHQILAETFGINHHLTLQHKISIITCLIVMQKYSEAFTICCSVEKIQIEILGINHPSTIDTKNAIATCLLGMGKYNEALEICYSLEKIQIEFLGINHLGTLRTKHIIALCLLKMGKYNEALEVNSYLDKIQTEVFGISNPATMRTKNSIAICLFKSEKYNEALEIHYSVDKIKTAIFGIYSSQTIETKTNIALCLHGIGKYNKALEIFYSADKIKTEILGANHPSTVETKINIANCLCKIGKYNEALEICYCVDKIQAKISGINHPSAMDTKNGIPLYLKEMGKYIKSVENFSSFEKIAVLYSALNHHSSLSTKLNIAKGLFEMGKYNEALEICYSADKKQTEISGVNHLSTLDSKNCIATCLIKMEKYKEALEILYILEKIQTEILFINHPSTMETKSRIAYCLLLGEKNVNEALAMYSSIHKVQTEVLGINHTSTLNTKIMIENITEALEIDSSIDNKQAEILINNHPSKIQTKSDIAICLTIKKKYF